MEPATGTLQELIRLGAAFLLGLPIGWERNSRGRTPGMRTFPLVALGACAFLLLGDRAADGDVDARARVLQALLTGIGFLAGGAILKRGGDVRGVATAAGLWITAAVGTAAARGEFLLAAVLAIVTTVTLHARIPRRRGDG